MAEEITKVIENVDELFSEIVVNGESHVSERYVEPPQASIPASTPQTQEEEPTFPQQTVQGEYVDTLSLNGVEHDLKDSPLSAEVSALQTLLGTIQSRLNELSALIPSQASAQNQLADKNFVNSSVSTNTANYISDNGNPFTSVSALEAYSGTVTNNDYAFVTGIDSAGNVYYDRYKATVSGSTVTWAKEYRLNNSSFTAEQWATINSGITQVSDTVQDGDTDPVSSDAVYEALQNMAVTPVNVVENNNMNAVTSNAVYNFKPANATHADSADSATTATSATSAGKLTTARKVYVKLGTASTTETKDFSGDTAIPVNGTLAVGNGGTGMTTASYKNAVVVGNASTVTNALRTIRTANGAFYATAQDGAPAFGTLPVGQGGTGATSLANITVGNSSKLGNVSVQTTSIGGGSSETGNHWSYVTKAKFTPTASYIVFSNGLKVQWGHKTDNTTNSYTWTLPLSYTSASTFACFTASNDVFYGYESLENRILSSNSISVNRQSYACTSWSYFCIGY